MKYLFILIYQGDQRKLEFHEKILPSYFTFKNKY